MPIKKIELDGLNPEHPLSKVVEEINANLDAVINAINEIEGGNGVVGETGAKGDKGEPGQQGIEGPAGKDGKDGMHGTHGKDGVDGKNGSDGRDGAVGPKGDQGIQGEPGPKGDKGEPGVPGAPGATGAQGPQGIQGLPGKDGKDGINGRDGLPGAQGIQGLKGDKGDTGAQGLGTTQKVILNAAVPTTLYTNADVPQWSASYTSSGGQVLVRADITAWTQGVGTRNWYLKKNGTVVATGSFFFNAVNTHMTLPPVQYVDTTGAGTATWSISAGAGLNADVNDPATITVTETVGMSNTTITKAAAFVDAGQFVTLDNLKFTVTTSGSRGLSCATVSGTSTLAISASYAMINGGYYGVATNWSTMPTYNSTTPSTSWFGWSFPNAGDTSTYNIQDVNNQRFYRVTLMIGPGYTKNFISIERLY